MPDMTRMDFEALKAAKAKYRTLIRQLEEGKRPHDDLLHPAYKLGQFLNEALPQAWSVADPPPAALKTGEE